MSQIYKIQVTEALRLKNQISEYFRTVQGSGNFKVYYGTTYIDNVVQQDLISNKISSVEYLEHFSKLCSLSEEINDKLSNFNRVSKIDSLVRRKANVEAKISLIERAINNSVANEKETVTVTNSGEKVKTITKFTPILVIDDLKNQIISLKSEVREIQNKVDKLNLKTIDLSFSFEDFDKFKLL
jgi:hypothetical protein